MWRATATPGSTPGSNLAVQRKTHGLPTHGDMKWSSQPSYQNISALEEGRAEGRQMEGMSQGRGYMYCTIASYSTRPAPSRRTTSVPRNIDLLQKRSLPPLLETDGVRRRRSQRTQAAVSLTQMPDQRPLRLHFRLQPHAQKLPRPCEARGGVGEPQHENVVLLEAPSTSPLHSLPPDPMIGIHAQQR